MTFSLTDKNKAMYMMYMILLSTPRSNFYTCLHDKKKEKNESLILKTQTFTSTH